jgi:hypothetical protein
MAKFGWAYVDCADVSGGGQAAGPTGSIQFLTGSNATNGSANLVFLTSSNTLALTGTLVVSGTIRANTLDIITTVQTEIDVSGSTNFGDSNDDTHSFTGSMYVGRAGQYPVFIADNDLLTGPRIETRGLRAAYRQITTSGLTSSNGDYILGVRGSGDLELRIHSAVSAKSGSLLVIKDELSVRTGIITLSASSGQTIDGDGYYQISGSSPAINLYSNGVDGWYVF